MQEYRYGVMNGWNIKVGFHSSVGWQIKLIGTLRRKSQLILHDRESEF